MSNIYAVTVPQGVTPGQTFKVQVNGRLFAVNCPPEASPGQVIHIQLNDAPPAQQQAMYPSAASGSMPITYPSAASAPPMYPSHAAPNYSSPVSAPMPSPYPSNSLPISAASTPISTTQGLMIPGLSDKLQMPLPPAQTVDWRSPYHLGINEEQLLDGAVKSLKFGLAWDAGCDVDGSVLLFNERYELLDIIWYRQLESVFDGAVKHSGDDRTGDGGGDDEVIKIKLRKLPAAVMYAVCTVSIFSGASNFQQVKELKVRVYHGSKKPKKNGKVIMYYDMGKVTMTGSSMLVAALVRKGAWWGVRALGESAGSCRTAGEVAQMQMPLLQSVFTRSPAFRPTLFNVAITIISGDNLAAKDISGQSDPFVKMEYRKQKSKSGVERKTLSPVWSTSPAQLVIQGVDEAEAKKVKISVWDWDRFSNPDFMGRLKIPLAALVRLGQGKHRLRETLRLDLKHFPSSPVRGSIELDATVQALGMM